MIYFVEGIFGSGKTTYARELYHSLIRCNPQAVLYCEHSSSNEIDFTRKAYVDKNTLDYFRNKYMSLGEEIPIHDKCSSFDRSVQCFSDCILLAYTEWMIDQKEYYNLAVEASQYEICSGKVSLSDYKRIIINRWNEHFRARKACDIEVYDGAFLQNIMIDLIAYYAISLDEITAFYHELLFSLQEHQFSVHYIITSNVDSVLKRAASARSTDTENWLGAFILWLKKSKYALKNNPVDEETVSRFCDNLQNIQLELLHLLKCNCLFIKER